VKSRRDRNKDLPANNSNKTKAKGPEKTLPVEGTDETDGERKREGLPTNDSNKNEWQSADPGVGAQIRHWFLFESFVGLFLLASVSSAPSTGNFPLLSSYSFYSRYS
jgi:hypothetical protein